MEEENSLYREKKELWDSINLEAIQEVTTAFALSNF